jgi:hypothetical protein
MMRDRQNGLAVRFQDLNLKCLNVPALLEAHPAMLFMSVMIALAVLFFLPASARAFSMELPVNCSGAELCAPQNYFDHDPSPAYADYVCGPLSYDTHTGTDIRISYADMERGVAVLAVADGVVRAVRDGEPEGEISRRGKASVKGREAGNAVVVVHGKDFETQYSHLKRASVAVRSGQHVRTGQVLGMVGLSGVTEFPHLEISVRHQGRSVDPYMGLVSGACGAPREALWSRAALHSPVLAYRASGVLEAGFFDAPPTDSIALLRRHGWLEGRAGDPDVLVFGVQVFGPRSGDVWTLRLMGPDGQILAESHTTQERHQAQAMRYVGKKKRAAWAPGRYRGEFRLLRPGEGEVVSVVRDIEVP